MLIELNTEITERLSKTELSVIQFINHHKDSISAMSILDIAFETYTSPATVSRAIRKCNLQGFNELRYKCIKKESTSDCDSANKILYQSLIEVRNIIESISATQILQSVAFIKQAEKIYVLGRGLSEYVAEEFSLKLQLLNRNSLFIKDPNIMKIKTQEIQEQDMVVIFSLNGVTPELLESAKNAHYNNAKIVCCCCNPNSELVTFSNIALIGHSEQDSCLTQYEVRSRLPLYVISRMITEYLSAQ